MGYSAPLTSTNRRSPAASLATPLERSAGFAGRPLNPRLGRVVDGDIPTLATRAERNRSGTRGEDRVVAADARAVAGAELRAALAHEDHPGLHFLAGEDLDPEHLRVRVAPVARRAESFFVSHLVLLLLRGESGLQCRDRAFSVCVLLLELQRRFELLDLPPLGLLGDVRDREVLVAAWRLGGGGWRSRRGGCYSCLRLWF